MFIRNPFSRSRLVTTKTDGKAPTGVSIVSPATGEAEPLEKCSDEVFGKGMMGPGALIIPSEGKIFSPVDGKIEVLFDTLHAFGFKTPEGCEVMLHVGIDTVELGGAPFVAHVAQCDTVRKGDLLLDMDLSAIEAAGKSSETLVIVTDAHGKQVSLTNNGSVQAGDPILSVA